MTAFTVEKSAGITTLGLALTAAGFLAWVFLGVPQQISSESNFWTTAGIALAVAGFLLLLIGVHRALSSLDAMAQQHFPASNSEQPNNEPASQ